MPNFTNLPERHFVDKAKKLSFGDQDKDTYFDGDTLNVMLEEIEALKAKKYYMHYITLHGNPPQTNSTITLATIVTTSNDAFTKSTLAAWLKENGFTNYTEHLFKVAAIKKNPASYYAGSGDMECLETRGIYSSDGETLKQYQVVQTYSIVDDELQWNRYRASSFTEVDRLSDDVVEIK